MDKSTISDDMREIVCALKPGGQEAFLRTVDLVDAGAPGLTAHNTLTDDGGVLIELENESPGRELIIAIPDDGHRLFFSAEGSDGYSLAGVAVQDSSIRDLAKWVAGELPNI